MVLCLSDILVSYLLSTPSLTYLSPVPYLRVHYPIATYVINYLIPLNVDITLVMQGLGMKETTSINNEFSFDGHQ